MKNKNERKKFYVSIGVAIGFAILVVVVLWIFSISQTSNAMDRNTELNLQLKLITEQFNINGSVRFYREISTDVMYFELNDGVSIMLDPKTGLPLTYSNWEKMYKNE